MEKLILIFIILFNVSLNAQSDRSSSSSELILLFSADTSGFIVPDNNNATTDVGTEADATTGWGNVLTTIFESQETQVNAGSSALHVTPSANSGRMFIDIHNEYNLTEGKTYIIQFDARHIGSGGKWQIGLGLNEATTSTPLIIELLNTHTAFVTYVTEFVHSSDTHFLVAEETNVGQDGGVYIDNLSIYKPE